MVHQLNLSSRPYRNRSLPWVVSALLLAVSIFGAFFVFIEHQKTSSQIVGVKRETAEIEPKIKELTDESQRIRESLTPEQQRLLASAHNLVDRKNFSWSRLFADLESVLPRDVIVSNVAVRDVERSGDRMNAELDFAVVSRDYQSVVNMLSDMNSSGIFAAELRGQDLQRDKGNLTEYTMRLLYSPRAGAPVGSTATAAATTAQNNFSQ